MDWSISQKLATFVASVRLVGDVGTRNTQNVDSDLCQFVKQKCLWIKSGLCRVPCTLELVAGVVTVTVSWKLLEKHLLEGGCEWLWHQVMFVTFCSVVVFRGFVPDFQDAGLGWALIRWTGYRMGPWALVLILMWFSLSIVAGQVGLAVSQKRITA